MTNGGALLLAAESGGTLVGDLLIVLATAAIVAVGMQRIRLALTPAYLIAGAIVGPDALGLVSSSESLADISHLAIILLLFGVGLHMDTSMIRRGALSIISIGVASIALTVLIGWPVAMLFGLDPSAAVAVSMALSLSSTAVVLKILSQRRELHLPAGRLTLGVLIVQDLAAPLMLMIVALLALADGAEGVADEGWSVIDSFGPIAGPMVSVGGLILLIVLGRYALPGILSEAARAKTSEALLILSVAVAIGAAAATSVLGFSEELGAFLAGFLLSRTPFRHQLSGQIGPARDLFVAVFFTTVGMKLHPEIVAQWWWIILAGSIALIVIKTAVMSACAWSMGAGLAIASASAFWLAQGGEFSLVILEESQRRGLLDAEPASAVIAIVVISLVVTPALMSAGRAAAQRMIGVGAAPWMKPSALNETIETAQGAGPRVVVGGFGPVGRAVADRLAQEGIAITIIEMNAETVRTQAKLGRRVVFGDVGSPEVLESAGIHDADALVLTIPDEDATLRACQTARKLAPELFIAVRTGFVGRGLAARSLGADYVTVDELATAEAMQREIVTRLEARRSAPSKK